MGHPSLPDGLFENLKHPLGVILPGEALGILPRTKGDPVPEIRIDAEPIECGGDCRGILRIDEDGTVPSDFRH